MLPVLVLRVQRDIGGSCERACPRADPEVAVAVVGQRPTRARGVRLEERARRGKRRGAVEAVLLDGIAIATDTRLTGWTVIVPDTVLRPGSRAIEARMDG